MRCASFVLALGIIATQPASAQQPSGRLEHGQELIGASSASSFSLTLTELHRIIAWTHPKPPSREGLEALKSLDERSFPVDTTASRIQMACDSRFNPSQFDEIITWFRSPLGLEVAEAERSAALLNISRQRQIREQVRSQWVSNRRMLLLGRLDDNLGLGSRQGTYALILLEDLIVSLNSDTPSRGESSEAHVQDKLQAATQRLESCLRDSVLFEMRVTYRSLSNDDLQRYNEFLESFSGRWYVELLQQGLEDAFVEGRERFLAGVSQISLPTRRALVP